MDHRVDLRERLGVEPYTVSAGDLLLTKLQIFGSEDHDLRDIVTLLMDDGLADHDAPGTVSVAYLAGLCAREDQDHVRAALRRVWNCRSPRPWPASTLAPRWWWAPPPADLV